MRLVDENEKEISEINMTPFVDIVLVILIIFMATATFIVEQKIPLNLPEAKTGENFNTKTDKIVISVNKTGIYIDNKRMDIKELKQFLKGKIRSSSTVIVLRADKNIRFQKVVNVIDICRELGLEKYIVETVR